MLSPGDRIGDWIVIETLGEGGMGAVFKAHNVLSKQILAAVKVLKQHGLGNARERFLREVELLASVQHPAVVRVLGGGEDTERKLMYMAMEYLEGEDLESVLARGPLPWEKACALFQQLGAGLLAAHAKGVVHRDIKPQNILITKDGGAKLLDFGIAVKTGGEKLTKEGAIPGTVAYMPPEVFQGKKPDHRGDIYALGVVLWETLTGKEAYPHDPSTTEQQNMVRIMGQKLEAGDLDPGPKFTPPLRKLVRDATRAEVDKRMRELGPFVRGLDEATGNVRVQPVPEARGGGGCATIALLLVILLVLTTLAVGVFGAIGGGAFLLARAPAPVPVMPVPVTPVPVIPPSPTKDGGWAVEAPTPSPSPSPFMGWGAPQAVPDGFPFSVPKDAAIMSGNKTTAMGMVSYSVVYTTASDARELGRLYDAEFKAKGLETFNSESVDANGLTLSVTGWNMSGSAAVASISPNTSGPGRFVSVSWVPSQ